MDNRQEGRRPGGAQVRLVFTRSSVDPATIASSPEVPSSLRRPLERLAAHEQEVLAWLAGDPNRAARFLVDPGGALRSSGLKLPVDLLAELERGLTATQRHQVVPSNRRLDRVTVEVDSTRAPGRGDGRREGRQ